MYYGPREGDGILRLGGQKIFFLRQGFFYPKILELFCRWGFFPFFRGGAWILGGHGPPLPPSLDCLLKLISKRWNCIPWVLFFLLSAVTKLSKLTKFECSPSKLCTLFLGFVPVLEAEVVLIKFGDRPLMSNGLGDVVPKKKQ